jgi:arabinose-5-phosphate isomerase
MYIDIAKRTLKEEADGIQELANTLDGRFTSACEVLTGVSGRIIVTGMGKSGHIARKIAATLSSVGKPAVFVHPAEANHGDMGMIQPGDAVIGISNSGETGEMFNLMHYCRRRAIPVVVITSNPSSTIGAAATVVLTLPKREACPLGLVPTTSTTMSLALGDALAVALYSETLTEREFGHYHPGGKLGRELLLVKQIMHQGPAMPLVCIHATMKDAILVIGKKALGCAVVVDDDNTLLGLVTDGDIRRNIDHVPLTTPVDVFMTRNPKTVSPDTFAVDALKLMTDRTITSLIVVDADQVMGVIHIHDCLRANIA